MLVREIAKDVSVAAILILLWISTHAYGLEPGESEEGVDIAIRRGFHVLSDALSERGLFKLEVERLKVLGLSEKEIQERLFSGPNMSFPWLSAPDLESIGTKRTVTLLIDFQDYKSEVTPENIHANIYASGSDDSERFAPYDSVANYYYRASETKLKIDGRVFGWYSFPNKRKDYEPKIPANATKKQKDDLWNLALFKLISAALKSFEANDDFRAYDNNNNGEIDLLNVIYAGPRGDWSTFWWAYQWQPTVKAWNDFSVDGIKVKRFIFQSCDTRTTGDFNPRTLTHETGHALGLADYYDYDKSSGGLGRLDMMDGNWGNHNAFSRWLLDWITPKFIGSGRPQEVTLTASTSSLGGDKAIAIFPGLSQQSAPSGELFIIEYRCRTNNDGGSYAPIPNDGLLVWHIDARVNNNGNGFRNNNSDTNPPLIRLVRPNETNPFEYGTSATTRDFFVVGNEFSPHTVPASLTYRGDHTNITLSSIEVDGERATFVVGFLEEGGPRTLESELERNVASVVAEESLGMLAGMESLSRQLGNAKESEIQELWQQNRPALGAENSITKQTAMQLLLTKWAAKNGQAAVEALVALPDSEFKEVTYPLLLESWANVRPEDAYEWYLSRASEFSESPNYMSAGRRFTERVFSWAALNDPVESVRQLKAIADPVEVFGALDGLDSVDAIYPEFMKRAMGIVKRETGKDSVLGVTRSISLGEVDGSNVLSVSDDRQFSEELNLLVKEKLK